MPWYSDSHFSLFNGGPYFKPFYTCFLDVLERKVREGSEYMSEHTSEVRGRVLGGGVHASESESES